MFGDGGRKWLLAASAGGEIPSLIIRCRALVPGEGVVFA